MRLLPDSIKEQPSTASPPTNSNTVPSTSVSSSGQADRVPPLPAAHSSSLPPLPQSILSSFPVRLPAPSTSKSREDILVNSNNKLRELLAESERQRIEDRAKFIEELEKKEIEKRKIQDESAKRDAEHIREKNNLKEALRKKKQKVSKLLDAALPDKKRRKIVEDTLDPFFSKTQIDCFLKGILEFKFLTLGRSVHLAHLN